MKKTLIINDVAPPIVQGGAILLGKLFKDFPEGSISILTGRWNSKDKLDKNLTLNCPYFFFAIPQYEGKKKWNRRLSVALQLIYLPLLVFKGVSIVTRNKIDNIFASVNRGAFFISAFFISKLTGKRFFIYLSDIYEELARTALEKFLARIFGRSAFCYASNIFVVNDFLFEYYKEKYNIKPEILPSPVDLSLYRKKQIRLVTEEDGDVKRIVFTGMIYWAQLDSFQNLVSVINSLDNNIKLLIYSSSNRQYLERCGLNGRNVIFDYAEVDDIPSIQRSADILFLPMTFKPILPLVTKTASTTKLAEYLAAERPILVHAPPDCFLSYYAKKEGFGYVVDNLDRDELKNALLRILEDKPLQNKLIENARKTVKAHDLKEVSERLKYYLWLKKYNDE